MASTSVSRVVQASPERVWQLVGGFHALPDWLPYIPQSTPREGGRVRRLRNSDGGTIVERMVEFNDQERHYSYAIVEAPFPVSGYLATLRVYAVRGEEGAAEVVWSGRFTPEGASEAEVVDLFTGIFSDGLDALDEAVAR
ncbi:SRPBCC family protein [Streptomyces sp. TS71-3]|uniref:SRPBCC family protein n=1 Tax=Streptomyces sp. TS71-3 TaxID=2733862 RepID=UPI001B029AD8|nr:SRPBCC family protein [Streptomyces sp. TS71-3]GHJ37112.1 MxaD family protein [Streptomyces sp. TS71-3]